MRLKVPMILSGHLRPDRVFHMLWMHATSLQPQIAAMDLFGVTRHIPAQRLRQRLRRAAHRIKTQSKILIAHGFVRKRSAYFELQPRHC